MNNLELEQQLVKLKADLEELKQYCIINIEYLLKLIESFNKPTE